MSTMACQTQGLGVVNVEKPDICRLCMNNEEYFLSIFHSNEVCRISIGEAIHDLLNLEVSECDGLPGTVCCQCLTKLMEFREFKEMCVNSAIQLRRPKEAILVDAKEVDRDEPREDAAECRQDKSAEKEYCEEGTVIVKCEPLELGYEMGDGHEAKESSDENRVMEIETKCELHGIGASSLQHHSAHGLVPQQVLQLEGSISHHQARKTSSADDWENLNSQDDSKNTSHLEYGSHQFRCAPNLEQIANSTECVCDHCGIKCEDKNVLSAHVREHFTGSLSASCATQNRTLPIECGALLLVMSEKRMRPEESVFGVGYDGQGSSRAPEVIKDEKRYKCELCGKGFEFMSKLRRHSLVHSSHTQFRCDVCGKGFKYKSVLVQHANIHRSDKAFKCEWCGKQFNWRQNLVDHVGVHAVGYAHACEVCGRTFATKPQLKLHVVTHSDLRPFKCEICGEDFKRKNNLKDHVRAHARRPFRCGTCGKSFAEEADLAEHAEDHAREKPHVCKACGKGFVLKHVLAEHESTHSAARPFACGECGKDFKNKRCLQSHMQTHRDEKQYDCETCGKQFKHKSSLMRHANVHVKTSEIGDPQEGSKLLE